MTNRPKALVTAPFRGEGMATLESLAAVVYDPWIEHVPLRLYDGPKLAARITDEGADLLIVESDFVNGPVFELPLRCIGSCRGDPNNVDVAAATAAGAWAGGPPARPCASTAILPAPAHTPAASAAAPNSPPNFLTGFPPRGHARLRRAPVPACITVGAERS